MRHADQAAILAVLKDRIEQDGRYAPEVEEWAHYVHFSKEPSPLTYGGKRHVWAYVSSEGGDALYQCRKCDLWRRASLAGGGTVRYMPAVTAEDARDDIFHGLGLRKPGPCPPLGAVQP